MTSQYKILYTPFRETRTKKREREKKENLVENKGKREGEWCLAPKMETITATTAYVVHSSCR